MRKCIICDKRYTFNRRSYFCKKCYKAYDIKQALENRQEWLLELIKMADRQRYSDRKFRDNVWLLGDEVETKPYRFEFVEDMVVKKIARDYFT